MANEKNTSSIAKLQQNAPRIAIGLVLLVVGLWGYNKVTHVLYPRQEFADCEPNVPWNDCKEHPVGANYILTPGPDGWTGAYSHRAPIKKTSWNWVPADCGMVTIEYLIPDGIGGVKVLSTSVKGSQGVEAPNHFAARFKPEKKACKITIQSE